LSGDCVGGKAETETGGVAFAAAGVELDETRGASKQEDKNAGGKWIERAKMADLAESGEVADGVHDVVRSFALRLVDDQSAVEGGGLWFAGHWKKRSATRDQRRVRYDLPLAAGTAYICWA
jgi:hypothetical protein